MARPWPSRFSMTSPPRWALEWRRASRGRSWRPSSSAKIRPLLSTSAASRGMHRRGASIPRTTGFHPINAGLVAEGLPGGVQPCTPTGVVELLERSGVQIEGANAVVVGRSNIVGKPTALLLLKRNATVTVCHTRTKNLAGHTRNADILVAAAGQPNLITKDMVKPGAAVVDVSTNRVDGTQVGDLGPVGDEVAGWLTPNPGGVGPMTRAMLVRNTYEAEVRRRP